MAEKIYRITYFGPDDIEFGRVHVGTSKLPSHDKIMKLLNIGLPNRPIGGWYSMETVTPGEEKEDFPPNREDALNPGVF